jgi:hypothetical protein
MGYSVRSRVVIEMEQHIIFGLQANTTRVFGLFCITEHTGVIGHPRLGVRRTGSDTGQAQIPAAQRLVDEGCKVVLPMSAAAVELCRHRHRRLRGQGRRCSMPMAPAGGRDRTSAVEGGGV